MADSLFRRRPLPAGLEVFDVHVNALPTGMSPPPGLYRTVTIDEVLDERADADGAVGTRPDATTAPRFRGGCMTPPAGIDLLDASHRLRTRLASGETPGWRALLRIDRGAGFRPMSGPLSTPRSFATRFRAREGDVGRALLETPSMLDDFAGVKLMPHASGLPGDDVLDVLARSGRPLLVHAGMLCPPRWIERHLLAKFEGTVILAHLGSWPCSADDLAYAVELAARDARVHLETSGANIGNFVRHAAEHVPEKLLFGSNRPMCPPPVQFAHVAAAVHDDDTLRAIAGGNARRLFPHASRPPDPVPPAPTPPASTPAPPA